jgi:hypothetical protein
VLDTIGNLKPMTAVVEDEAYIEAYFGGTDDYLAYVNQLPTTIKGTDASVEIKYAYNSAPKPFAWEGQVMGDYGESAGGAYVFEKIGEQWFQSDGGKLVGYDTDSYDLLGHSVALEDTLALVGAPGSEDKGFIEEQVFSCNADGGHFRFDFRGRQSVVLPFDAEHEEVRLALNNMVLY